MSYVQFIVQIVSWAFIFYLHSRTLKRGELARVKDTLIKTLNELPTWVATKLDSKISVLQLEDIYAGKISSIELMIKQLNGHKNQIVDINLITKIRNIDIASYKTTISTGDSEHDKEERKEEERKEEERKSELMFQLDTLTFELVSHIENEYFSSLFSSFNLPRFIEAHKYPLLGATCGALIMYCFFYIFEVMYL